MDTKKWRNNMQLTPEDSFILIKFQGEGDAQPELYFSNVNAFQVMGAAATIEVHGKNLFIRQENERYERQQQDKLSIAKPEVLVPKR